MRRMKDMAAIGGGIGFYRDMPESYRIIINANHKIINEISSKIEKETAEQRLDIDEKLDTYENQKTELEDKLKDFKTEDEKPIEDKEKLKDIESKIQNLEDEKTNLYKGFGKQQKTINQLIDLALLANNLLKGEALNKFVNRSVELLEK